jgi:hypothetical protein
MPSKITIQPIRLESDKQRPVKGMQLFESQETVENTLTGLPRATSSVQLSWW